MRWLVIACVTLQMLGCGAPQRPPAHEQPEPLQVEMESLRAAHFVDGSLGPVGLRRLESLLDFHGDAPEQADVVARVLDTPEAHARIAIRAAMAGAPEQFDAAASRAIREKPASPQSAVLLAVARRMVADGWPSPKLLPDAVSEAWNVLHPQVKLLAVLTPWLEARLPAEGRPVPWLSVSTGHWRCTLDAPWRGHLAVSSPRGPVEITWGDVQLVEHSEQGAAFLWRQLALGAGGAGLDVVAQDAPVTLWLLSETPGPLPQCSDGAHGRPMSPMTVESTPRGTYSDLLEAQARRPGAWTALRQAWWWAADPLLGDSDLRHEMVERWRRRWPLDADGQWAAAMNMLEGAGAEKPLSRWRALAVLSAGPYTTAQSRLTVARLQTDTSPQIALPILKTLTEEVPRDPRPWHALARLWHLNEAQAWAETAKEEAAVRGGEVASWRTRPPALEPRWSKILEHDSLNIPKGSTTLVVIDTQAVWRLSHRVVSGPEQGAPPEAEVLLSLPLERGLHQEAWVEKASAATSGRIDVPEFFGALPSRVIILHRPDQQLSVSPDRALPSPTPLNRDGWTGLVWQVERPEREGKRPAVEWTLRPKSLETR
ncbi:MAG: hypothetical protein ACE366_27710 [Bradymonadia bacterium]